MMSAADLAHDDDGDHLNYLGKILSKDESTFEDLTLLLTSNLLLS